MLDSSIFKIATEPWEFDQIHRLNYETFVQEIPQHHANDERVLVDKFHGENTYIICLRGQTLLGMVAVRGQRPFSLDKKLDNLDAYLPRDTCACEVRLLAVKKDIRHTRIIPGLLEHTIRFCLQQRYDLALISGIVNKQRLYEHMGFVPFGPLVGNEKAMFQPMYLTFDAYRASRAVDRHSLLVIGPVESVNLMPGPVDVSTGVEAAFHRPALSHRSEACQAVLEDTKRRLCELTGARFVELFMGSGTLANDVIAGQLSLHPGPGLILSNGEFGERLIDQARRFDLTFESLSLDWTTPFDQRRVESVIERSPHIHWLWAVHCETSTGMLNDASLLKQICHAKGIDLCLDCVSSMGTVPVDLADVYLASSVSGKGLQSYSGLSMVFYNHILPLSNRQLPAYLDLSYYKQKQGVPYTMSSNLVAALQEALQQLDIAQREQAIYELSSALREDLAAIGIHPLVSHGQDNPSILTFALDEEYHSQRVGDALKKRGFVLSYNSTYLLKRNWIQICLMSQYPKNCLTSLPSHLHDVLQADKRSKQSKIK